MIFIWYHIWGWSDHCTKSHVQECLHHWTGLPGDDRTLIPGDEDQGGIDLTYCVPKKRNSVCHLNW